MIKNYVKIILRNLSKNKFYSFISIFGLAVGISASTLIALFVVDELSFDSHNEKIDRIYRVTTTMNFNGPLDAALTNMALAPTLKREYPEVESYTRFFGGNRETELTANQIIYKETNIWFTDSTVFDVFTYEFIFGDPNTALVEPNSIVITKSLAEKLFGERDCLEKELKVNNSSVRIKGVIKDPPKNSEIRVNGLISLNTLPQRFHAAYNRDWFRISTYTFLLMNEAINPISFEPKLDQINEDFVKPWAESNGIVASHDYLLTPLSEVHFDDVHDYDQPKGKMSNIYIFLSLAIFLLLIAIFNYINLTLAQQGKRSKEVGIRKTLGASRGSLIIQFLSESIFFTSVAFILGLAFTELFLDGFNELSGKDIHSIDFFNPTIIVLEISIFLTVGILSGAYPAFLLSSLKPTKALSGEKNNEGRVGVFRKSLVMVQFFLSIFMIIGTFLISDQMKFIRTVNLGFDRENLISVSLPSDTTSRKMIQPWIDELTNNSRIKSYSNTSLPTGITGKLLFRIEKNNELTESTVNMMFVDEHFIEVLGLDVLAGRNFSTDFETDMSSAFIVNQTAVNKFGWNDDALNKRVQWGLSDNGQASHDGKVIGVVNDFNFLSLHNPLEPLVLCFNPYNSRNLSIRLNPGNYTEVLNNLETSWNKMIPEYPFEYTFFDQDLEENYAQENKTFTVFSFFSIISIILACFGLFAVLSYSIQTRAKEIGVRKVLGASITQISWVIVKDFVISLLVAFILSMPLAYYLWQGWQQDFAYQAPLNLTSVILTFFLTITLVSIAVIYHIWQIAKSDPIVALREE